ncbi:MAG: hypothetical protein HRU01_15760 [Myxococcales bacterium]|nr:hypothetical protein [Myxococcales bacterium]
MPSLDLNCWFYAPEAQGYCDWLMVRTSVPVGRAGYAVGRTHVWAGDRLAAEGISQVALVPVSPLDGETSWPRGPHPRQSSGTAWPEKREVLICGLMDRSLLRRSLPAIFVSLLYLISSTALYESIGDAIIALSVVPIVVFGHTFGPWGGGTAGVVAALVNYQLLESAGRWPPPHEPELPFYFASLVLLIIGLQAGFVGKGRMDSEREVLRRQRTEEELRTALAEVRTLRGIVPICSGCKKIRRDDDTWVSVELFVQERSEARFTHGICPECSEEFDTD